MANLDSLLTPRERVFAAAIVRLNHANPFTAERIAWEKQALGDEFVDARSEWNLSGPGLGVHPNLTRLQEEAAALVTRVSGAWPKAAGVAAEDRDLYAQVVVF